jgi:hypothetical protein
MFVHFDCLPTIQQESIAYKFLGKFGEERCPSWLKEDEIVKTYVLQPPLRMRNALGQITMAGNVPRAGNSTAGPPRRECPNPLTTRGRLDINEWRNSGEQFSMAQREKNACVRAKEREEREGS